MKTKLTEKFTFEAAHRIRNKRKEYGELHGHTHKVYVTVSGEPDPEVGWLIGQQEFRGIVGRVVKRLDHRYLNEIMDQTTAESIALYLFKELEKNLSFNALTLDSVKVCKTTTQAEVSR